MLKKIALASSLVALALLVVAAPQLAIAGGGGGCTVRASGCEASNITFTADSNPTPPFPPCNVTLYRMNATILCGIGFGDPVQGYVCPSTDQPLYIQLNGQTHTFAPESGRTWADVISDCDYLTYSVN